MSESMISREYVDYERVIDIDNGDTLGFYAEGHINKTDFCTTIRDEEDREFAPSQVTHGWMKISPLDEDDCDEYAQNKLDFFSRELPGCQPVTYCGDI